MFWLILLLILLYFIAAPIIRVWRKVRQFQNEFNRNMNGGGQNQNAGQPNATQRDMAERYRRYSDATAENVEFEELEGPVEQEPEELTQSDSTTSSYQEEIVSDVEFEDIKEDSANSQNQS